MEQAKVLLEALREEGIQLEEVTVRKNGILCNGLRVVSGDDNAICPVVYYSPDETIAEILNKIHYATNLQRPKFDTELLKSAEYVKENAYLSIQKKDGDGADSITIKRPCLNLEVIARVAVRLGDSKGSIKVDKEMLKLCGLSEEELWECATNNTKAQLTVYCILELLGMPSELVEELEDISLYACTTITRTNGAVALYFPDIFREFCVRKDINELLLIPSSTDELIVCLGGLMNPKDVAQLVQDVNGEMVDPIMQLPPVVYAYRLDTNEITILANAE